MPFPTFSAENAVVRCLFYPSLVLSVKYSVYGKKSKKAQKVTISRRLHAKVETSTLLTGKLCYDAININILCLLMYRIARSSAEASAGYPYKNSRRECRIPREQSLACHPTTPLRRFLTSGLGNDTKIKENENRNSNIMRQFISHPELIIYAFMLSGLGFRRFQLCPRARAYMRIFNNYSPCPNGL